MPSVTQGDPDVILLALVSRHWLAVSGITEHPEDGLVLMMEDINVQELCFTDWGFERCFYKDCPRYVSCRTERPLGNPVWCSGKHHDLWLLTVTANERVQ